MPIKNGTFLLSGLSPTPQTSNSKMSKCSADESCGLLYVLHPACDFPLPYELSNHKPKKCTGWSSIARRPPNPCYKIKLTYIERYSCKTLCLVENTYQAVGHCFLMHVQVTEVRVETGRLIYAHLGRKCKNETPVVTYIQ